MNNLEYYILKLIFSVKSKYLLILGIFLLLAWTQKSQNRLSIKNKFFYTSHGLKKQFSNLSQQGHKKGAALLHAIVTGDKTKISKKSLETYKHMGVMHVLTPSGLHLGGLFWLKKYLPLKFYLLCLFIITLFVASLSHYFPIKRVLLFKWLNILANNVSLETLFYITFCIDLLLGFYQKSPFSTLLSFLFWGTIITHKKFEKLSLTKKLIINMLLVNLIFKQSTAILAFILNPIFSILISLAFPALGLTYISATVLPFFAQFFIYILEQTDTFFNFCDLEILLLPPTLFTLLSIASLLLRKRFLFICILLIFSKDIGVGWKLKIQNGKWLKPPSITRRR